MDHPNATAAHIDRALGDEDMIVRYHATVHPNATAAHIDRALGDDDERVRQVAGNVKWRRNLQDRDVAIK